MSIALSRRFLHHDEGKREQAVYSVDDVKVLVVARRETAEGPQDAPFPRISDFFGFPIRVLVPRTRFWKYFLGRGACGGGGHAMLC